MLADDLEWNPCLTDAAAYETFMATFRELFVTIRRHCDAVNPVRLWETHFETLVEDLLYRARKSDDARQKDSDLPYLDLLHIDGGLRSAGYNDGEYHLPTHVDPAP